ncbi:MAG: tetratricopeptide repeat protein, partial [Cyclobacteriaceae bacterium]
DVSASFNSIGIAYSEVGNYTEAIKYYKKALEISEEINNENRTSRCLSNIGSVYNEQGNYPLALEYYNKSLAIDEKIENTLGVSKSLNNIGIIYKNLLNYDKAIASYEKALKIQEKNGNKKNVIEILNNLGNVYKKKRNYEIALKFLEDALKLSEEINNRIYVATILNNIGDVHLQLNDEPIAFEYFVKAEKKNLEVGNQRGLCNSYLGMATVYVNQENYYEALNYALKSQQISNKLAIIDYQRDVSRLLSKIYQNIGDYKKAFESHQQFKILSDSLFNKENIEKITQLEYEYKYKQTLDSANIRELKLTKTVQLTSRDLEASQRNLLLGVITFLAVALVLGSIIFFLKLRNVKSETQNIVTEQKLLRSQMTPHFIFNSLSVLQGMILDKEDKKSVNYLSKFSKLLRITLENSRDKTVLLSHELDAIENYLALQNLENELYRYTILVDDAIDKSLIEIPPMLIQPFVENAIEHAFSNQPEIKKIDIHLSFINENLTCTITDNGIGIDASKENENHHKKSLSTTITSERLKVLSEDFKMKGSVIIEDRKKYSEQGTKITLVIPYKILAA